MPYQIPVELLAQGLLLTLMLSLPPLMGAMGAGLLWGAVARILRLPDVGLATIPRLVAALFSTIIFAPWIVRQMLLWGRAVLELMEKR